MKLLAIDTSTLMASVAVAEATADDGSAASLRVLAWRESDVDTHSDRLLPLIDAALGEAGVALAEVDEIAVGAGPGSFTGLRIGMATAKGLAFAAEKPLRAVSSLAALAMDVACPPAGGASTSAAAAATRDTLLVPVLDARRHEVFAGFYRIAEEAPALQPVAPERVIPPAKLREVIESLAARADAPSRVVLFGDAVGAYGDELASSGRLEHDARTTPSAVSVARLTVFADDLPDVLVSGAPVYIRPSEAEIKFPRGNPGGTFSSPK